MHIRHILAFALCSSASSAFAQAPLVVSDIPDDSSAPVTSSRGVPESGASDSMGVGPGQRQAPGPRSAYGGSSFSDVFTVELGSNMPELGFEVYSLRTKRGKDSPIASCPGPCRIKLARGSYDFWVTETETTRAGRRRIAIEADTRITFDPDTKAQRTTGLVLGITGPILLFAGAIAIVTSDALPVGEASHKPNDSTKAGVGWLLLLGGMATTPIGWVMFGKSMRPEFELSRPASPPPSWSFGVAPVHGGLSLGGNWTF